MNANEKDKAETVSAAHIVRFVISVVAFGVLMGARSEFSSIWTRSLVAGIAGAILGSSVLAMRRRKP